MIIPPLKSQGIKTKLVSWLESFVPEYSGLWIEPFMGTGVAGFNLAKSRSLLADINPHIVKFYIDLQNEKITPAGIREWLQIKSLKLERGGSDFYHSVRDDFNARGGSPLFLFLNRTGFNGLVRFNKNGGYNVPFCGKNKRFSKSYISKIVNQMSAVLKVIQEKTFEFRCLDFRETLALAGADDFIYCDPPYLGRNADYYNSWTEKDEKDLFDFLKNFKGKFILSTWERSRFRENPQMEVWRKNFAVQTREHFYHLGGRMENRHSIVEAIVKNF